MCTYTIPSANNRVKLDAPRQANPTMVGFMANVWRALTTGEDDFAIGARSQRR